MLNALLIYELAPMCLLTMNVQHGGKRCRTVAAEIITCGLEYARSSEGSVTSRLMPSDNGPHPCTPGQVCFGSTSSACSV